MAITDILFHPIFLLNIGITLLVIGCLFFYIEIRNRQQNHKLVVMSSLISSIHNKVSEIDYYLTSTAVNRFVGKGEEEDNEEEEEEEEEEEQEENIRLIHVSDDEDEDDEDEHEDEDEEDEDEDEDEEDEEEEQQDVDEEEKDSIKVIRIEENYIETDGEQASMDVLKMEHYMGIELEDAYADADADADTEEQVKEVDIFDLKSIDILEVVDYTKYSVAKLKQVVAEKGLANDTSISKLKKNELLKLLGV